MRIATRAGALAALVLAIGPAHAQDHPLIGHLEGSTPMGYAETEFDETNIIVGPMDPRTANTQRGEGWKTVEGKIFHIYHRLPDGLSSLAGLRNYEKHLKEKGFDIAFTCNTEAGTCFTDASSVPGLALGMALDGTIDMPRLEAPDLIRNLFYTGTGRYLLATMSRPEGTVYVGAAFSEGTDDARFVISKIVETGEIEYSAFAVTKASDLQDKLDADGKVDIYGIQFGFDKADIKPESKPQLEAIAELLKGNPDLRLNVVGHTDNQGTQAYNADLSDRRARAVVAALGTEFGIDQSRLTPIGRGFAEPLTGNDTEEGRAQNRRVELSKT